MKSSLPKNFQHPVVHIKIYYLNYVNLTMSVKLSKKKISFFSGWLITAEKWFKIHFFFSDFSTVSRIIKKKMLSILWTIQNVIRKLGIQNNNITQILLGEFKKTYLNPCCINMHYHTVFIHFHFLSSNSSFSRTSRL